jgi:hypothetical protein
VCGRSLLERETAVRAKVTVALEAQGRRPYMMCPVLGTTKDLTWRKTMDLSWPGRHGGVRRNEQGGKGRPRLFPSCITSLNHFSSYHTHRFSSLCLCPL